MLLPWIPESLPKNLFNQVSRCAAEYLDKCSRSTTKRCRRVVINLYRPTSTLDPTVRYRDLTRGQIHRLVRSRMGARWARCFKLPASTRAILPQLKRRASCTR